MASKKKLKKRIKALEWELECAKEEEKDIRDTWKLDDKILSAILKAFVDGYSMPLLESEIKRIQYETDHPFAAMFTNHVANIKSKTYDIFDHVEIE